MGAFFWLAFSVFGKCAISLFPYFFLSILLLFAKITKGMKNGKGKEKYFKDFRFQLLRFSKSIFFSFTSSIHSTLNSRLRSEFAEWNNEMERQRGKESFKLKTFHFT
jgi:hypothetical protein